MEILFIFWYGNYVVLLIIQHVTEYYFYMNVDKIIICQIFFFFFMFLKLGHWLHHTSTRPPIHVHAHS